MSPSHETGTLSTCGCCGEDVQQADLFNRPGQPSLAYRVGTHGTFMRRMLAQLVRQEIPDGPNQGSRPLANLGTRASDDPAIALMDACATVADVLSFYQERIANEGFLRTATERRSVLELARAIGYELAPGVAASTYLAFTVEDAPGAPGEAVVPKGMRILSIPGQDELPQSFETADEVTVRAAWNALRPRQSKPQAIQAGTQRLYLKGVSTQLQPGDAILLVGDDRERYLGSERWDFRILQTVTVYPEQGYTLVTWDTGLGHEKPTVDPANHPRVFVFRQRAALFGHNAPDWRAMPETIKQAYDPNFDPDNPNARKEWPNFEIPRDRIDLDARYPKVLIGSWVVLLKPSYAELYKVVDVDIASRTDYTLTAQVTRIVPDTREHLTWFPLRDTVVYAQSEQLELIDEPITEPVHGDVLVLDHLTLGLRPEQPIIVSGKRPRVVIGGTEALQLRSADGSETRSLPPGTSLQVLEPPTTGDGESKTWHLLDSTGFEGFTEDASGQVIDQPTNEDDAVISEVAFIESVTEDLERTTIELAKPLQHTYDRTTVTINANVVAASHGETTSEVLGSGDGSVANQRFVLKKTPLTYVSAATTSGAESTLEVRVNDVLWEEAPSLYGLAPRSQSYAVRIGDDGQATVIFGDGRMGARLPSGQENVTATYRTGLGPDGEVRANSLALMQARPLGVRSVTNPLPASGAAAPETLDEARTNAPFTVLTLERIVSLRDFENFARAFAGIGKAQAASLWQGETRLVHLTIATASGETVDPTSALFTNLATAIDLARDPVQQVRIDSYEPLAFKLTAGVLPDPRYVASDVLAAVEEALRAAFTFERRAFGQAVTAAEVVSIIQGVPGVVAAALQQLYLSTDPSGPMQTSPAPYLLAARARWQGDVVAPAQLLLLDSDGIELTEMTA